MLLPLSAVPGGAHLNWFYLVTTFGMHSGDSWPARGALKTSSRVFVWLALFLAARRAKSKGRKIKKVWPALEIHFYSSWGQQ